MRDGLVQSYPYKHNLVPSVFSLSTRNVRRVVKVTFSSSQSVKSLISQVFTKWNATSHLNNYENLSIKCIQQSDHESGEITSRPDS